MGEKLSLNFGESFVYNENAEEVNTKMSKDKKEGGMGTLWAALAGAAAGAAAVFFSKEENREMAKERLEEGKKKAEEAKKKLEKKKKELKKKAEKAAQKAEVEED